MAGVGPRNGDSDVSSTAGKYLRYGLSSRKMTAMWANSSSSSNGGSALAWTSCCGSCTLSNPRFDSAANASAA